MPSTTISACRMFSSMNPVRQLIPRQLRPGGDHRGQGQGYLWDGNRAEHAVRAVHIPDARLSAHPYDLQVRRLDVQHLTESQSHGRSVPAREHRVRRQPVDLVRGRGAVRRRDPAGLHELRALGHRRVVRLRRLRLARLQRQSITASSRSSTSASSRSASRSQTTRSSRKSCSGSGSGPSLPRAAASSTGSSASSIAPSCRS